MNTGRSLSFIIKTVNACNLNCTYCYAPKIQCGKHQTISEDIQIKLIKGTVDLGIENVQIVWHGSEPLIAGIDFFKKALEIQGKFGQSWQIFQNVMQTNATLIDDSWVQFLKENKFGIGVSLDGPSDIHDANRLTKNGKPTHYLVQENYLRLKANNCDGGICAVVNTDCLQSPKRIVDYFSDLQVPEVDLLPCFAAETNYSNDSKSISADEYAQFMIRAFDRWIEIDNPNFRIRFFENVLRLLMGGGSQFCKFRPDKCSNFLGIDTDGSVYPCDLFVGYDDWKLGSLADDDLSTILFSDRKRAFYRCMENVNEACFDCQWYRMCWGGCSLHRYLADKNLQKLSVFCESRKEIFSHISKSIELAPPKIQHKTLRASPGNSITKPTAVYIDLGPICNSKCYFCAASSTEQNVVESIPSFNISCLKQARKQEVESLIISGGESTIHSDILSFITRAKGMGFKRIELQTNGKKLSNQEFLKELIEAGITDFGISLHGDTPDLQDAITQSSGSFIKTIKAIENINLLFGPNPPLAVNCVVTPENKERLKSIVSLLISYNVSTIKLSYLHGTGRAKSLLLDGHWPSKLDFQPYILDGIRECERKGKTNTSMTIEAYPSCIMPDYEMYSSDFFITPIYRTNPDGSIYKFHTREDRVKGPNCDKCTLFQYCLGPWKEYPDLFGWNEFKPLSKPIEEIFENMDMTK